MYISIDDLIVAWQTTKKIKGHAKDKTIEDYGKIVKIFLNSGLSYEEYLASIDPLIRTRTHNRDESIINEFLYWAQVNGFLKENLEALYLPNRWTSKYRLDLPEK